MKSANYIFSALLKSEEEIYFEIFNGFLLRFLQGCKAARLQGCKAARLQGCKAARPNNLSESIKFILFPAFLSLLLSSNSVYAANAVYGDNAQANGFHSTAFGENAQASGDFSTAIGNGAQASGYYSTATG
ncbi:TPA: hypothetical protein ACIBE3_005486, partial [Salmonella enterica subsp. enterica serovar Reading]